MKWYIAAVIALFVLVPVGFGVWKGFQTDLRQPALAERFKQSFVESCSKEAEDTVTMAGHTVDAVIKTRIGAICTCAADATVVDLVKDNVGVGDLLTLPNDPAFQAKITDIMQACQKQIDAS